MSARTIDHILPKALGGSKGSWTNRAGSCFSCNQAKAHTPLLHFMLEQQGVDLSHLKNEDGHWPIPRTPDERRVLLVAQEEAHARLTPSLNTHEVAVIAPEPACAGVAEVC